MTPVAIAMRPCSDAAPSAMDTDMPAVPPATPGVPRLPLVSHMLTMAAEQHGWIMHVREGMNVSAGQVIARIDERDAQAGLARSDAAVAQAEAELRNALVHIER